MRIIKKLRKNKNEMHCNKLHRRLSFKLLPKEEALKVLTMVNQQAVVSKVATGSTTSELQPVGSNPEVKV